MRKLTLIAVDAKSVAAVLERAAELNVTGGTVYDFLIASCALESNAEVIYTWNERHYRLFGTEVERRVRTPMEAWPGA